MSAIFFVPLQPKKMCAYVRGVYACEEKNYALREQVRVITYPTTPYIYKVYIP